MSVRSINLTRLEEAFGSINAIPCISVHNSKFKVVTCWSVLSQNANKDVGPTPDVRIFLHGDRTAITIHRTE